MKKAKPQKRVSSPQPAPRVLVIVPTYNEIDNLPKLADAILTQPVEHLELLIVDDNSPDGTGKFAKDLAKTNPRVHVLHRQEKAGLGAAYVAGFTWALSAPEGGVYDYVVTMDADFSHNPNDIPRLLAEKETAAIVIGSRYIPGGTIVGWDWRRYANSYGANIVTKLLLGLPVRDATAGFKVYQRAFLASLDLAKLIASGYAFQVEMLVEAHKRGLAMAEVPITFVDRRAGESKIEGEMRRSAQVIFQLAGQRRGLRQFVKFCVVGFICMAIDWTIFFALLHTTGLGARGQLGKQLAKALSFSVAVVCSYVLNRRWTFRSSDRKIVAQAIKFFSVATVGLALNNAIFYLINAPTLLGWPDVSALFVATVVVTFWNFFANKYWTFRVSKRNHE